MEQIEVLETLIHQGNFEFVESVPADCHFPDGTKFSLKTGKKVIQMLKTAKKSIKAISFYFTLRGKDVGNESYPTANVGEEIYNQLEEAAKRGVKIHLLANMKRPGMNDSDMSDLQNQYPQNVSIGFVDMSHKNPGYVGGICHTKLWIIDDRLFYVGSSNMDWRSYTEIVESGIAGEDTSYIMPQLNAIYLETCKLSSTEDFLATLQQRCGDSFVNKKICNLVSPPIVVSSSPDIISNATGTKSDKSSIMDVINTAQKELFITTYVYSTLDKFSHPEIFDLEVASAIRAAAIERGVIVNVIVDEHSFKIPIYKKCLCYLARESDIKIWLFNIKKKSLPEIPYAKLWHSKLVISESKLWVSTNNIHVSYWTLTCGIGLSFDSTVGTNQEAVTQLINDAKNHVVRYLNSEYVEPMSVDDQIKQ